MKILIADPNPEVQSALQLIINLIPEVTEVSETNNLIQLLAECSHFCPDLLLFDIDLLISQRYNSLNLPDFINVIHRICPCIKVIAMSSRFQVEYDIQHAGIDGYISKTDPPDEVISVIVRLLRINSKI
jgi:DNA-binding NarL/FixJ family response regulator